MRGNKAYLVITVHSKRLIYELKTFEIEQKGRLSDTSQRINLDATFQELRLFNFRGRNGKRTWNKFLEGLKCK